MCRSDTNKECNICLEDMKSGEEVRTISCMHSFHSKCIDPVSFLSPSLFFIFLVFFCAVVEEEAALSVVSF